MLPRAAQSQESPTRALRAQELAPLLVLGREPPALPMLVPPASTTGVAAGPSINIYLDALALQEFSTIAQGIKINGSDAFQIC